MRSQRIGILRRTPCRLQFHSVCYANRVTSRQQSSRSSQIGNAAAASTHSTRQLALHALPLDLVSVPQVCFSQVSCSIHFFYVSFCLMPPHATSCLMMPAWRQMGNNGNDSLPAQLEPKSTVALRSHSWLISCIQSYKRYTKAVLADN